LLLRGLNDKYRLLKAFSISPRQNFYHKTFQNSISGISRLARIAAARNLLTKAVQLFSPPKHQKAI